jgi:hypothetical protein
MYIKIIHQLKPRLAITATAFNFLWFFDNVNFINEKRSFFIVISCNFFILSSETRVVTCLLIDCLEEEEQVTGPSAQEKCWEEIDPLPVVVDWTSLKSCEKRSEQFYCYCHQNQLTKSN